MKRRIIELFFEIWKEDGRTVLAVTHDVDEAAAIAQRILVLSEGKIVSDFEPEAEVPRPLYKGGELRERLISLLLNDLLNT